jgi:hypothetical protein
MLKQPCSTSDLGQAPSNQSTCWPFKRVCPISSWLVVTGFNQTNWTGPSKWLARAWVRQCLSNRWSNTDVQELLNQLFLTNQCQQWSLPHSKLASNKDFSNTQVSTCQLPVFEQVFIAVPHPGAVPVHFHKNFLNWSTSATKLVNSMQNICTNVDNFPKKSADCYSMQNISANVFRGV